MEEGMGYETESGTPTGAVAWKLTSPAHPDEEGERSLESYRFHGLKVKATRSVPVR